MKLQIGRGAYGLSNRMEAELTAWLHGFEPSGAPIALRLRAFADLRAEAERPRRRFAELMPALSSTASLAVVVLGTGLILALAIAGASLGSAIGSPAQPYPGGQVPLPEGDGIVGNSSYAVLVLLVISCLAGGSVLLRRVRAVASHLAFGRGATEPAALLPLRRRWRSIPRLTWLVGALGLLAMLLPVRLAVQQGAALLSDAFALQNFLSLCSQIVAAPLALVVSWRYPRRDRSSRLLHLFALASLASLLWVGAVASFGDWPWWPLLMCLGALGTTFLVAGLAGRCGSVRRPPLWLAAPAVGGTLFLVAYPWADQLFSVGDPGWLEWVVIAAAGWIVAASGLAITWVGLDACRRGGSRAWWLVLAAGALEVSSYSFIVLWVGATIAGDWWSALMDVGSYWMTVATTLSTATLLAALLIGLRPVPPDEAEQADPADPREPAEQAPAPTPAI